MNGAGKRATRSDKLTRVNAGLDKFTHDKLRSLAFACDIPKTNLAAVIIETALNTPSFINAIQERYGAGKNRVIPIWKNGEVYF